MNLIFTPEIFRLAQVNDRRAELRYVLVIILPIFKCSVFSGFIKNIDQVQPVLGTLRCHDSTFYGGRKRATAKFSFSF